MSALDNLNKEAESQKRKISEIEKSIEIVEKEFDIKFESEREDIKEQKDFINDPRLQIAIVGAIKAGKSTFINALFQDNIASTEVTPETASLTKFRYSDRNKLTVKFYNEENWARIWESVEKAEKNNKGKIFKEEFESLKAENYKNQYIGKPAETIEDLENIEELKRKVKEYTSKQSPIHFFVEELTVYLNNENVPKDIVIVDTPGLDDVVDYRSNTTKDYINRANAVIVCVNSSSLRNEEFKTINGVFDNVGDDLYKVIILGTQIDNFNSPKEDWGKQSIEWKNLLKDFYKEEKLLNDNIIGVSSYVESSVIELEETGKCDKEALENIKKLARSFGINLTVENSRGTMVDLADIDKLKEEMDIKAILKKSSEIRNLTNIGKVNSLIQEDIISKGMEIAIKDLEKGYFNMITNISNKAKSIYEYNSESRNTLDMNEKEQERFKLMKNKEIEEIETAMNGLNDAFEKIKTQWLNENKKLKEAINK